jgi:hypothetical protein
LAFNFSNWRIDATTSHSRQRDGVRKKARLALERFKENTFWRKPIARGCFGWQGHIDIVRTVAYLP